MGDEHGQDDGLLDRSTGVERHGGCVTGGGYHDRSHDRAGGSHSCAVVDGGVRCWGANDFGQLGNPAFGDVDAATDVAGLRPGTNAGVTAVAAGDSHTCAIVNGGVQCWGYNGDGQLGVGDTTKRDFPTPIPNLTGVTAIAAGNYYSCAIELLQVAAGGV